MDRILIVDDSPVDLALIAGLLEREGSYEVETARDGEQALAAIRRRCPDLVLTDMVMPVLDGLALVRAMAEDFPLVPVVLATGQGSEELAVEALELGAASYVSKHRLDDLVEIVERVIGASEHRRVEARLMEGLLEQTSTFEIRSDRTLLRPLIAHVQRQLAQIGFGDEGERTRIGVALEEAMNNALEHGNLEVESALREESLQRYVEQLQDRARRPEYADRRIRLESTISRDEVRLVVRDQGKGFDPARLPDPKAPENLERAHGRGILLMRTFMDEVDFRRGGTEVALIRRASAGED